MERLLPNPRVDASHRGAYCTTGDDDAPGVLHRAWELAGPLYLTSATTLNPASSTVVALPDLRLKSFLADPSRHFTNP